jgi:alpha-ketoglutarate-dependent taurine dioxygenase
MVLQAINRELGDEDLALFRYLLQVEGVDLASGRSIPIRQNRHDLPLSFAQQRLWFLHQLDPMTTAYNNLSVMRLSGPLDVAVLERSFNAIVRRHEVLRTTFALVRGQPVQVIAPAAALKLALGDLQQLPAAVQMAQVERLASEDVNRPFDLSRDLFLRATLLRLSRAEHVLIITLHHSIWDAQSAKLFFAELESFYRALRASQEASPPPLSIQYADFACWQREWLQGPVLEQQLAYWRAQLAGAPALLELPTDYPRPAAQGFHGACRQFELPASEADALDALGQRQGSTLFMVLLAAFQVLLSYYTGQTDIVVGTDVSDRSQVETEPLIGFFVNQLALRADLSGNPGFRELLRRVRKVTLEAFGHRDVPIEQVVQALKLERRLDYSPLFQVKIYLMHGESEQLRLPGITILPVDLDSGVSRHDLTFALSRLDSGIGGYINYNVELFRVETIAELDQFFKVILAQIARDPDLRLSQLTNMLASMAKEKRAMERTRREDTNFKKFKQIGRKTVGLPQQEPVKVDDLQINGSTVPVIQPDGQAIDLADWTKSNRDQIDSKVRQHGAVLFRGFQVHSPAAFERFALVICPRLFKENSEHTPISTNGNVQTPVFYPPYKKLLWHNENTFNHSWPLTILFGCVRPAQEGGETPIVDSRKVFERIPAAIRERFREKQIMYVRNYGEGLGLDWQTVFRTTNKEDVEELCRKAAVDFEWRDGDRLHTRMVRPALGKHPKTGEMVWFNQAQHWHISCLDEATRASMVSIFEEQDLPRNCYYGDGSRIEDSAMQAVLQVYQDLEVSFPWLEGDVVILDNMLVAHGRNPFVGERKILVAMGDMISYEAIES